MTNESLMNPDDLIEVMVASAEVFSKHRVKYSVVGGMAASYRSQPRFTKNLDFLLAIPQLQLPAVLESLLERGFQFDTMSVIREWTQEHMTVLSYRGFPVDWLRTAEDSCLTSPFFRWDRLD